MQEEYRRRKARNQSRYASSHRQEQNARQRNYRAQELPFVAIDSEGISYGEKVQIGNEFAQPQRTVFWMAGKDDTFDTLDGNPFCDADNILEWLCELPRKFGRAIFVWFGSSYDATQIFLNLPYEKAWELQNSKPWSERFEKTNAVSGRYVYYGQYAISYIKQKCLRVRRLFELPDGTQKLGKGITIYDVFGFFQTSFIKAAKSIPGSMSSEDETKIEAGKAQRGAFSFDQLENIKSYTKCELRTLAKMMEALRQSLKEMGINLQRWQGAGSIAAALMKKNRAQDHFMEVRTFDLSEAQEWAHCAFFGGRIELMKQGCTTRRLWSYDIKSAYPYHNSMLPSMARGRYEDVANPTREQIESANVLSMFEVEFICETDTESLQLNRINDYPGPDFYPLPYRDRHGRITFPPHVRGIYMAEEVRATFAWLEYFSADFKKRTYGLDLPVSINVMRAKIFHPHPNATEAMAWIREMFERRAAIQKETKKTGIYNLTEKVIKLGINSLYGKTAQSVGNKGKAPATANPWYAAAITAGTRAQLLRAALRVESGSIVAFQTDGIISTRPLDIPIGGRLGDWECDELEGQKIFVQPGIYYLPDKAKHRGIKRDLLDIKTDDDFCDWLNKHVVDGWKKGILSVEYPYRYYVTLGASVASEDRFNVAGHWVDSTRIIQLDNLGFKRATSFFRDDLKKRARDLVDSFSKPAYFHDACSREAGWQLPMSEPHRPQWLDDEFAAQTELARLNEEVALTEG